MERIIPSMVGIGLKNKCPLLSVHVLVVRLHVLVNTLPQITSMASVWHLHALQHCVWCSYCDFNFRVVNVLRFWNIAIHGEKWL